MTGARDMRRRAFLAGAGASVIALCACTTTTVTSQFAQKPERSFSAVAIGDISAEPLWQTHALHLRNGLARKLREQGNFSTVSDPAPADLPADGIVVSGRLVEMDKGSAAARFIIGFGAGRARARGEFVLVDRSGTKLAQFQTAKAYSGGAGIGGIDFVDMDDLAAKLGEEVALALGRWSKGGPLEPPE